MDSTRKSNQALHRAAAHPVGAQFGQQPRAAVGELLC
jgi:hypothetical protein